MADGGIGESMLLGAAMGGGSAALMGRDPLKGAMVGGLTGGVTGGISSALAPTGAAPISGAAAGSGGLGAAAGAPASALTATSIPGMVGPIDYSMASVNPATTGFSSLANSAEGIKALPNMMPAASAGAPTTFGEGMSKFASNPLASLKGNMGTAAAASLAAMNATRPAMYMPPEYNGPLKRLRLSQDYQPAYAEGGITDLASGGDMSVGGNPMDQSDGIGQSNWQDNSYPAAAMASGGIANLGSYSDGGRMLKGPGDGMSDSIPADIAGKRPARLADGEFVVPADVVSHLGNGSTDAGAKQLYAMMDKVRTARTGRKAQGREINPRKYVPV